MRNCVPLVEPRVLSPGFFEDWDTAVGIFPEAEKVLVFQARLGSIAGASIAAGEAEMRQCTDRFVEDNTTMVQNLLELGCGLDTLVCSQVGLPTNINRI